MAEVVAELSQLARESPHLNQRSGVSVRLTIANYETLVANATRRALRNGEDEAVPRVSDLQALVSSTQGKVEIESLEEGREEILLAQLVSAAVLLVFRRRVVLDDPQAVVGAFTADTVVHAGDDLPASAYAATLGQMPALSAPVLALTGGSEDPGRGGQRRRVPAGGPAPHQTPQQGGGRGPGHLSGPRMTWRFDYRRWDGTQDSLIDDTDSVLSQLTDDLLANGDLHEALQRMLNRGWRTPDGEQVQGLRDLLDQLRLEREEQLDRGDLGGAYREVAEELQEVLAEERTGIEQLQADAHASGDQRRQEVTDEVAAERRMQLDLLPDDLAGTVRGLQNYEFVSSEARQHFEELMERLREEVAKTYFEQMSEALANPDPEQLAHMREALRRPQPDDRAARGGRADRPVLRVVHGAVRRPVPRQPGRPRRAAGAAGRPDGRGPGHVELDVPRAAQPAPGPGRVAARGHRSALAGGPAGRQPAAGVPRGRVGAALPVQRRRAHGHGRGDRRRRPPAGPRRARGLPAVGHLAGLPVRGRPGQGAGATWATTPPDSLDRLAKLAKQLADAGLIDQREGRFELTPKGIRRIGQQALSDLFGQLTKDRVGNHRTTWTGTGHDREETTKPYEFGDPFNLDLSRTVHNAVRRAGSGVPVRLSPDDFEVIETEALTRSATVLLFDLSLSMPMRDNFVPAKKMAMALHTLISTRFPRDYLGLVGFSEVARVIEPEDLPTVSWDYVYGTNLQHGLILARKMLAHQQGTKQIILVTDGEPTAHVIPYEGGRRLRRLLQLPARCPRRSRSPWPRSCGAPGPGSPSTPSCSTPTGGFRASSSSWPGSTGAGPSPPRPTSSATTSWSTSWPTRPTLRTRGRRAG